MNEKYMCYCGLYCENCAVKVKVEPASKKLYEEMKKAGFEGVIEMLPDGDKFWIFLKGMVEDGVCISCKEGDGNPNCAISKCAIEKGIEMCVLCESYPCEEFTQLFEVQTTLKHDNLLLHDEGIEAWSKLQDKRRKKGFIYQRENKIFGE
jgi:hypothetical protein